MKREKTIRIVLLISIAALALFSILAWRHSDKVSGAAPQRTEETTLTATPTVSATAIPTATATETPVVTKPVGDGTENNEEHGCCGTKSGEDGNGEQKDCCGHKEETGQSEDTDVPDCCGG